MSEFVRASEVTVGANKVIDDNELIQRVRSAIDTCIAAEGGYALQLMLREVSGRGVAAQAFDAYLTESHLKPLCVGCYPIEGVEGGWMAEFTNGTYLIVTDQQKDVLSSAKLDAAEYEVVKPKPRVLN